MIKLIKMNQKQFQVFSAESQARRQNWYRESLDLTKSDAENLAKKDFDRILTKGFETEDNFIYSLIDNNNDDVGFLWYSLRKDDNKLKAFICDILVRDPYRGKGYGKRSLELLEEQVKLLGISKIGLHVIANNKVAFGLYKSMGYEIKSYLMDKVLT